MIACEWKWKKYIYYIYCKKLISYIAQGTLLDMYMPYTYLVLNPNCPVYLRCFERISPSSAQMAKTC
jgi:hypothetical protein